jgi:hypothetical protein
MAEKQQNLQKQKVTCKRKIRKGKICKREIHKGKLRKRKIRKGEICKREMQKGTLFRRKIRKEKICKREICKSKSDLVTFRRKPAHRRKPHRKRNSFSSPAPRSFLLTSTSRTIPRQPLSESSFRSLSCLPPGNPARNTLDLLRTSALQKMIPPLQKSIPLN